MADIVKFARDAGAFGLLVLILVGGYRKWWVWGYQVEDMKKDFAVQLDGKQKEIEQWRAFALRGTLLADRATILAETAKSAPLRLEGS